MTIEEGMKVRINNAYCDYKEDGFTRESNLRFVVATLGDGFVLLAKTKKQALNGEGFIYSTSNIEKVCGWY